MRNRMRCVEWLILVVAVSLAACNSGGGGSEGASKKSQTIAFANAGPVAKTFGDPVFMNAATGGAGSGSVSYLTHDSSVATIASDGSVTIIGAGTVVIDAIKAADSIYSAAQASFTLNVARAPQLISFAASGPIEKRTGDEFDNVASGGGGSGAVSYSSDTPAVATVDADTGSVSVVGVGSALISATKAASANHLQAQANYSIVATARRNGVLTTWTGDSDTELHLDAAAVGADLIRPTTAGCIQPDIAPCMILANTTLSATTFLDGAATTSRPAPYWLRRGNRTTEPVLVDSARVGGSSTSAAALVYQRKLWFYDFARRRILSSDDGQSWVLRGSISAAVSSSSTAVVFHGKIWILSGLRNNSAATTDVCELWSSDDGVTLTLAARAPFRERFGQAMTVFNDRLWVVAGAEFDWDQYRAIAQRDIWSSGDGVNWVREVDSAPFEPRYNHRLNTFNGRLWLIAGEGQRGSGASDSRQPLKDVWSSSDGRSWRPEASFGHFRSSFATAVVGGRMLVSGGYDGGQSGASDLWYTEDGNSWIQVPGNGGLGARMEHIFVAFRQKLWSLGGTDFAQGLNGPEDVRNLNEVWSSADGLVWTEADPGAPFTPRDAQKMIEFGGRLWIFGSRNASQPDLEVWSSADGDDWHRSSGASVIPPRLQFSVSVFNQKLWVIGGGTYIALANYTGRNDVWSSVDGETWIQETAAAAFPARWAHSTFVLGNRLYVVGGSVDGRSDSSIWSSPDGVNWVLETASAAFGAKRNQSTVTFNGRVWLYGGSDGANGDIWSSADGATWTREKQDEAATRTQIAPVELNGRLWILGGDAFGSASRAYSSSDGVTWRSEAAPSGGVTLADLGFGVFQDRLWLFGTGASPGADAVDTSGQIWSSADGASWRMRNQYTIEIP